MTIINTIRPTAKKILMHSDKGMSPRELIVEITTRCNLKCVMCPRAYMPIDKPEEMNFANFKLICDKFKNLKTVSLLGKGETLLHKELDEIISYLHTRRCNIVVTTNGTLLSESFILKNRLQRITHLTISLDSIENESFQKIRGIPIENVIGNFVHIKRLMPDTYIRIQTLVFQENLNELSKIIDCCEKFQFNEVNFLLPIHFSSEDETKTHDIEHVKKQIDNINIYAKKHEIKVFSTLSEKKPRLCFSPWNSLRIAINGDVYPCCYIYNSLDNCWIENYSGKVVNVNQKNYLMGNLIKQNPDDFWNKEEYRILRKTVYSTTTTELLPDDELNRIRDSESCGRFGYCKGCLFRQNRAC